jgi:hypothetical protein
MDNALLSGIVPEELPFIKKASLRVLGTVYSTVDSAKLEIRNGIMSYYEKKHPEVLATQAALVEKAITGMQGEYLKNTFPAMKASSVSYLNHIGHMESDGCFRCHSGRHTSEDGKTISKDCNLCHSIIQTSHRHWYGLERKQLYGVPPVNVTLPETGSAFN